MSSKTAKALSGIPPRGVRNTFDRSFIPEPNSGCWLWLGKLNAAGYGNIFARDENRKVFGLIAHRVSYWIEHGHVPAGVSVCHRCDMPSCVNPEHLFLGTQEDNIRDCVRKKRHRKFVCPEKTPRGEAIKRAKLNAAAVSQIKALAARSPRKIIATQFGVGISCIDSILTGRTWRHVV